MHMCVYIHTYIQIIRYALCHKKECLTSKLRPTFCDPVLVTKLFVIF